MKIKFLATSQNHTYAITGTTINGLDLSSIDEPNVAISGNDELIDAGIRKVETDSNGELFVTLQQRGFYDYPVVSHDWTESDWIDAATFDPNTCYIVPLSVQGKTDYGIEYRDTTVTLPSGVEQDASGWYVYKLEAAE